MMKYPAQLGMMTAVFVLYANQAYSQQAVGAGVAASCPGIGVQVNAPSSDEHRLVCSAAADAIELFAHCRIALRRPLQVEVSKAVRNAFGGEIFGRFDDKRDAVLITRYANIPKLIKGTAYDPLPQAEFYRSLIVHEVVHGVMHQNYKRQPTSHAAYEYPAYALQLALLPAGIREKFLQDNSNGSGTHNFLFNDYVLSLNPFFFAASAYEHFTASPGGCTRFLALLEGEVDFIATLP